MSEPSDSPTAGLPGPGEVAPAEPDVHLARLARRIRTLREARGLTQEDFARASDISPSFASLLERGERSPSLETLLQVAAALDVPLSELFLQDAEGGGAGEERLVHFARERGLTRLDVDRLLAVADAMFRGAPGPDGELPEGAARCVEEGCGRAVLARGLCVVHYHRARRARREAGGGE